MAMAMLDDVGAGPSGSSNQPGQGAMGSSGMGVGNGGGVGGYRYSAAYDDSSSHPQHAQQQAQQQQTQSRQSFVGSTDNPRARYPSPSRNANTNVNGTRDSFRASSYSVGNLSNLSLSGQLPAPGGWDDLGAPTRPYDDYGGAGGSGSNGRQSPYGGGRASPAQYTGRQSPLFTPNLPPRLSQGNLRAQSDGYAFPVAGAVPNNPTSSSSPGQRRTVLERTNTEDTLGAGGRLSFPSTNDPPSRVVSAADPDMMMDDQMRYSRSSAYLTHPPERPSSLSISNTPPSNAPRHPGVPTSGLPPSTPYASLVSSPMDSMNMGIRTSIVSQPQTAIYNHINNSGNFTTTANNNNGTGSGSNPRPMSGSTGYIAGGGPSNSSPGPSQAQINSAMGQNQNSTGSPSPTPQSQGQSQPIPTGQQGRQSPYLSNPNTHANSPNNYPLSQSPQQQQTLQARDQAQAQAQASRSISPARASGSGFRQPSPPQGQAQGQASSSIPALPSSLSARTSPPAQPRDRDRDQQQQQQQSYAPYQPPLPTQPPSRPPPPPEEVCVECAMRDQDMADVDVLSPGVWERESDIAYADRLAHEDELAAQGLPPSEDPPPIVERGDRLTERHLKIWMSVNPKEPTSRQQTLNAYVKSQRALLEAEALAQAQALAEDRMREARVRDAQLRRSAYDGPLSAGVDEYGSLGQGYPQSSRHHHAQARSLSMPLSSTAMGGGSSAGASIGAAGSRNTTLLENGMIVEQIDVKKEEREERERRKREERRERDASRARKSSRGSGGASVYSAPLPGSVGPVPRVPTAQDQANLRPGQRTSQFSLNSRPASVLSSPLGGVGGERERPGLPRAYSQYSLAESAVTGPPQGVPPQSGLVSPSPRRSRFFGFGRSRDSLAMSGMSGSMVDMHMGNMDSRVATEATHGVGYYPQYAQQQPGGQARWSTMPQEQEQEYLAEEKAAKKKRGLLKLWKIVTGTNKPRQGQQQQAPQAYQQGSRSKSLERRGGGYEGEGDGEGELAPPPPLSYLMARSGGAGEPPRQAGAHSPLAPGPPQSPQTAGAVPSRRPDSILDGEMAQLAINAAFAQGGSYNNTDADTISRGSIYAGSISHQGQVQRDKSLPPLPPEARLSPPLGGPGGARTPSDSGRGSSSTSTYFDMKRPEAQAQVQQGGSGGYLAAPPFRNGEGRRQSFGGVSNPRPESMTQTLPSSANYTRSGFMSPGAQQQGYQQGYNQSFDQGTARARGNTIGQMQSHQYQPQGYPQDPYSEFGRVQSRPTSTLDYGSTTEGGGTLTGPKKRRSRFGLTSLFGKKGGSGGSGGGGGSGPVAFPVQQDLGYQNHVPQGQGQGQAYGSMKGYPASFQGDYAPYSQQAQAYPTSSSEDAYYGGAPPQAQGRPMSTYQQQQGGARMGTNGGGRMSVASRKAVEELVDQDREFVAYRYPSAMEREAYEREIRR